MIIYLSCHHCGKTFEAQSKKARFCGSTCRKRAERDRLKPAPPDPYSIAEDAINALTNKPRSLKSLFIKIAWALDEQMFLSAYLQIRERGEDARLAQQDAQSVTNNVTKSASFDDAKLAFKLLAYHEAQAQDSETVLQAIEEIRSWLNQIQESTYKELFT